MATSLIQQTAYRMSINTLKGCPRMLNDNVKQQDERERERKRERETERERKERKRVG